MSDTTWNSSNTRIVVDSATNVPLLLRDQYNMIEVPVLVNFGTESFRDNIDLRPEEFYERFAASEVVPTTSQPPPKYFADAYQQAFDEGARHIVVVTITGQLSGTLASSQTATQFLEAGTLETVALEPDFHQPGSRAGQVADEERFLFWDSESISMGSGWQAVAAARMLEEGLERRELVERLYEIRSRLIGFATLDTLKYVALSGRVSNLQANIGNLLHVKAMLEINNGLVTPIGRARGRRRSLRGIVDRLCAEFEGESIRAGFMHALAQDEAEEIADAVQERLQVDEFYIGDIGPAIASFGGYGAIGLVGYPSSLG